MLFCFSIILLITTFSDLRGKTFNVFSEILSVLLQTIRAFSWHIIHPYKYLTCLPNIGEPEITPLVKKKKQPFAPSANLNYFRHPVCRHFSSRLKRCDVTIKNHNLTLFWILSQTRLLCVKSSLFSST